MGMDAGIGSFGKVVFRVSSELIRTLDEYSRVSRARYADHDVLGGKQASEFTGMDQDELSFVMPFSASLGVNPEKEADDLRDMAAAGKAYLLMLGGTPKGYWTIREIGETVEHFLGGKFIETRVDISLREYNETIPGGVADSGNRPQQVTGGKPPLQDCVYVPRR